MTEWGILDADHNVVPVIYEKYVASMLEIDRSGLVVAQEMVNGYYISTVFLQVNTQDAWKPPEWFETSVLDRLDVGGNAREFDQLQIRCATWGEALAQHNEVANMVLGPGRSAKDEIVGYGDFIDGLAKILSPTKDIAP